MEDPFKKFKKMSEDMLSAWCSEWLQRLAGDEVIRQFRAGAMPGNQHEHTSSVSPYRILGLDRTDSDEQIKTRFKELVVKLHPDTAGVKGTEFFFQQLMAAYQLIKKERGWK